MAIINNIQNQASVIYDGSPINSNTVSTTLLLPPLIEKEVDKLVASIGEILTYTITITNVALTSITDLPFLDEIPEGSEYVNNSFTLNGNAETPTLTDNTLNYTISSIDAQDEAVITFQVEVMGGEN